MNRSDERLNYGARIALALSILKHTEGTAPERIDRAVMALEGAHIDEIRAAGEQQRADRVTASVVDWPTA